MEESAKLEQIVRSYCMTRFNREHYLEKDKYGEIYGRLFERIKKWNIPLNLSGYSEVCRLVDEEILNTHKD